MLSSTSIFKSEGKLRGTITIFPTNEIETINQLNTFTKLVGEKKLEILGSKEISAVINTDAIRNINSNYFSPTSLLWEFTNLLEKKLFEYPAVSQMRTSPINHLYYKDHVKHLIFTFKINESEKSRSEIFKELNQIFNETANESRDYLIKIHSEKEKDLKRLIMQENSFSIKKIENLEKILSEAPAMEFFTKNNATINASIYGSDFEEKKFEIINYCLEERNEDILDICAELVNESLKIKSKIVLDELIVLGERLSDKSFKTVRSLNTDIIKIYKEDSNYLYAAFFVASLIISLIVITISELINLRKK